MPWPGGGQVAGFPCPGATEDSCAADGAYHCEPFAWLCDALGASGTRGAAVWVGPFAQGGSEPGSIWVRGCDCGVRIADSAPSASSAVIRWTGFLVSMAARSDSSAPARSVGRGSSSTTAVSAASPESRSKGP